MRVSEEVLFVHVFVIPLPSKGKKFKATSHIFLWRAFRREFLGTAIFKTTSSNRFGTYEGTSKSVLGSR
jgi:hypothetical protein